MINVVEFFDGPREFEVLVIPRDHNMHHLSNVQFSLEVNPKFFLQPIYNWWVASALHLVRKDPETDLLRPRTWISGCAIHHKDFKRGSLVLVRVLESTCNKPIVGAVICNLEILKKYGDAAVCGAFHILKDQSYPHQKEFLSTMQMDPMQEFDRDLVETAYQSWIENKK